MSPLPVQHKAPGSDCPSDPSVEELVRDTASPGKPAKIEIVSDGTDDNFVGGEFDDLTELSIAHDADLTILRNEGGFVQAGRHPRTNRPRSPINPGQPCYVFLLPVSEAGRDASRVFSRSQFYG